jgi:phosphoglycerol transferase
VAFVEPMPRLGMYNAMTNRAAFEQDRDFVRRIEARLPPNSAIYQLPYMPFPGAGPLHGLGSYDHLTGFLNSRRLRWSFGAMKGREVDRFYRELSSKPMADQISAIKKLGFAGIYVDRRGYADNGAAVVAELTALIGTPTVIQAVGPKAFFELSQ